MRKGMTIAITLVMAMLVALVVAFVLISMFGTSMDKGGKGLTGSLDSTTDDVTGLACSTHCATCCITQDEDYCEDTDHGAPSPDCECPNC